MDDERSALYRKVITNLETARRHLPYLLGAEARTSGAILAATTSLRAVLLAERELKRARRIERGLERPEDDPPR